MQKSLMKTTWTSVCFLTLTRKVKLWYLRLGVNREVWPHLHSAELQAKLFPVVIAVPEIETIDEEAKNEHAKLHRRWAATRLLVSRG